jgi:methylated-DNA-[protein]-cysteine S-methyltransferase
MEKCHMKPTVWYDRISTPLGTMLLATDGVALTGAWFDRQRYLPSIDAEWQRKSDDAVLRRAAAMLDDYFAGKRARFDVPMAPAGTAFQRAVWNAIAHVPYGETTAYRDLAAAVGRPASVRAAGAATGRNPLSIFIPCHRIIGADGALTGYAGGLDRKRALLALERGERAAESPRRAA